MSQNPFAENSENPYLPPHQPPPYQPVQLVTPEMQKRALAKVYWPAVLMQVYGVLIVVVSAALLSIPFLTDLGPDNSGTVIMRIIFGCVTAVGFAMGVFTILTAQWMKRLRGWGWALAGVIVSFIFAVLFCPLIVLVDSEVRACFDQPIGKSPFR